MTSLSRRTFMATSGSTVLLTAACGNGVGSGAADVIDARVDATLDYLYSNYPNTTELRDKSAGILVMPLITKAGFGVGGSFGRGALRIDNATVDYYSATSGTFGFQIGVQQYAHTLFFMTEEALQKFRRSQGWAVGADVEYTVDVTGENLSAGTTTSFSPVVALIFGQAGLIAGATLKGTKYSRIIP